MFQFFLTRPGKNRIAPSYIDNHYVLYDKFTTNRAAGAINGTSAEPKGGTRTVTDTNSKITLASQAIAFATGGVANDGIWYTSLTRTLGKVLKTNVTPSDTNGVIRFGWDSNSSGVINDALQFAASGVLSVVPNGGTAITVGAYTATPYQVVVIMRATGVFWYIKGGAFTYWTLIWITAAGTNDGVPALNINSTSTVFTATNIRVPNATEPVAPLESDGFSASTTDGAGNAEANGPVGDAWTGATWAVAAGAVVNTPTVGAEVIVNGAFAADTDWTKGSGWSIAAGVAAATLSSADLTATVAPLTLGSWYKTVFTLGSFSVGTVAVVVGAAVNPTHGANGTFTEVNRATSTAFAMRGAGFTGTVDNVSAKPLTLSTLFRSLSTLSANVIADVAVTRTAGQGGLVLNLDSAATPANFVIAYHDGVNAVLEKCVAGVYTSVISAVTTYSAGAQLRAVKDGTSYSLYYNNAKVGSTATISDVGIISNTLHGLFDTFGNSFDNFVLWARGNEAQYDGLDNI